MIYKELEKILIEEKTKGSLDSYTLNLLKEYLQVYVLYYIYTNSKYNKNLIFTGGTCLRHFYNLPRLSEDLDFDFRESFDSQILLYDLEEYFKKQYKFNEIKLAVKQRGNQIVLKFAVLHKLGLAKDNESNLLYVKLDFLKNPSKYFDLQTTSKSIYGFNFVAKHYDLSSLMSRKIHAVLIGKKFQGLDNIEVVKGRDYFDLLWFLKNSVKPNLKRLSEMLNIDTDIDFIEKQLDLKVKELITKHKSYFESELMPLISNPDFIKIYVSNYYEEYLRFKKQLSKASSIPW
ncbi:MAG: nucleotidyl transferase AbiEii/AbiGii toxin family protein [Candidatus Hydromicrobium sp.]|nr:nucleotidyl transferase AbiEii/AbiGii toxin family protein [Candidatus Hydromicrobium sp.]